uniref:Glycolate oxidase n=1 Tax=Candidatus Kentrum eta TaxID=2126337 RepID=A0A450VB59_9GAMM|nr:MAG: glycolate oxidase [Candidatus Kentron sp. H]VFJ95832.1 MAG: glycolate oxidase [Candidatus Kentron sp. H]VFK02008.1 MAG: glycolate oxidase [Candidatus Kentron sp. H]
MNPPLDNRQQPIGYRKIIIEGMRGARDEFYTQPQVPSMRPNPFNAAATTAKTPSPMGTGFMKALGKLLPFDAIITREEATRPYECDALSAYRQLPRVVVLPRTVEEVRAIMGLCHERGVPVVARGAGTGVCAGALPHETGVLLSLARLTTIGHIDPLNRTAQVQAGVRNLAISEAAAHHGLYYAPDPSSQLACTVGGNIAENAGGVHCLKYGLTVHNVLELQVVTVQGELVEIGGDAPDSPGFDLLALMIGSEGMLGVVVAATVRLLPVPESVRLLLAAFDDVEKAGLAVGEIIAAGIIPAGLEMMDNPAIVAIEDYVHAGYPVEAAAVLLCDIDGDPQSVTQQVDAVRALLIRHGATEVRLARDEAERERLWRGRKSAFPAMGRIAADYYCMDGTIPRRRLPEVLSHIGQLSRKHGLPVANVFHAGDGNLHPLIMYDANRPDELARAEAFGAEILELCVAVGGTITGEHGVGVEKLGQMCVQFSPEELAQFRAVKDAFDPQGLLNPGKGIPTPRRCSEYRMFSGRE